MIIQVVDYVSVAVLKSKNHAPIARDSDRPVIPKTTFQRMQAGTRVIHIAYDCGGIQSVKYVQEPLGMLGLDSLFRPGVEQLFQTLMPEALDH